MTRSVFRLDDIRCRDVDIAGGKGANLGALAAKGFPVPPGFVVSAHACRSFFGAIDLAGQLPALAAAGADDVAPQCQRIREIIARTQIPSDLSRDILCHHQALVDGGGADIVCAVRSSATAEDLGDASFAGQHATYYYVAHGNLLEMIKNCWASLWNPEAVSYRSTQGIDHGSVFMAVVVQEMIQSEVSGVTFTANPVSGARDEIVTEASWGMGAAIVDGRVTPDHYIVSRDGLKLRKKRIADKRFMVPARLDKGIATRLREVPHGLRRRETLSLEQAQRVAEWALKAETHFGAPQDVEWAMSGGAFFMLQSRPITVMGREQIGQGEAGRYVIFKPLVENFTDPITPLTRDLLDCVGPFGVKFIGGRAYVYLKFFKALLPFELSDAQLARLLYEMGAKTPPMKLSVLKLPIFLAVVFLAYLVIGVFFARTRRLPDDFMDGYRRLCRRVEENPALTPVDAMWRLWPWFWTRFFDPAGFMVILVNLSAPRYMVFLGLLQKVLRGWVPELGEDAESLLCSGSEGVLSAEMGRGIWELAKEAKKSRAVGGIFERHKPEKILSALKAEPQAARFLERLYAFLDVNGHRALKELELQSVRWEENPAPVLGMVRNYLLAETDPTEHENRVARNREALKAEIRRRLDEKPLEKRFGLRRRLIDYLAERTRYFAKMRENSRFYHVMGLYCIRKKILAVEADLLSRGRLRCKDDIFYLRYGEVAQLQAGWLEWRDVEDRIRERRMEHVRYAKMVPPKTIGVTSEEAPQSEDPAAADPDALAGQPASPGRYEGLAHVILDPSIDIELKPGEVLVAPYTDPAWTPLFLTAGAAVVEVGSYLSHAGTVAREFGMPCVVDLPECTQRIHTGAAVQVDGDRGVVRIMSGRKGAR